MQKYPTAAPNHFVKLPSNYNLHSHSHTYSHKPEYKRIFMFFPARTPIHWTFMRAPDSFFRSQSFTSYSSTTSHTPPKQVLYICICRRKLHNFWESSGYPLLLISMMYMISILVLLTIETNLPSMHEYEQGDWAYF